MNEILLDFAMGVRLSNDVGGAAEDMSLSEAPDCGAGGSEIVSAVAAMVAEAFMSEAKGTRSLISSAATEALEVINEMKSDDEYYASTFKNYGI